MRLQKIQEHAYSSISPIKTPSQPDKKPRYIALWRWVVIVTSIVALTPLIILSLINFFQYRRALEHEFEERVNHMTSSTKRSLEYFIGERRRALTFTCQERTYDQLADQAQLGSIFEDLQQILGDIVDLGFIDASGKQITYAGPYEFVGKDYSEQDWFHEVILRGHYVSDVFMGYRNFPHFVIAVAKKADNGKAHVLRATVDYRILLEQIQPLKLPPPSEAFIINKEGVLQTPSINYGQLLEKAPIAVPSYSNYCELITRSNKKGQRYVLCYAHIESSPFILMIVKYPRFVLKEWFGEEKSLWLVLCISMVAIVLIIMGVASSMIARLREAERQRTTILHELEFQSKMASLGRLAAGVAHEINNPLAIINEKAGMIKDVSQLSGQFPSKEKVIDLVDSILYSVERCSKVTHRLLGFAKHLDVKIETIELDQLINEVIGFLRYEASYRDISIDVKSANDSIPPIQSDRGQLQQALLNILNNSLNALGDSGKEGQVVISLQQEGNKHVSISISDNGPGISEENLKHIFDPFFTTRSKGTGLGLSITYGIIDKLGGAIDIESKVGVGTTFKVTLPTTHR